jgi:hypothetical protein
MRKTSLFAVALLAAAAMPALAQTPSPGESFIIFPPQGWVPQPPIHEGNAVVRRLLPPGVDPAQVSEAINVERYDQATQTPKQFVGALVDASRKSCEGLQVGPLDEKPINGYKAASLRFACTKSSRTGKSGLMMVIAVAGKDALHVVQRMWLGQPVGANDPVPVPDAVIGAWDAFAARVTLCDAGDAKHPCPPAAAP